MSDTNQRAAGALAAALALSALVFAPPPTVDGPALAKRTLLQVVAATALAFVAWSADRRARALYVFSARETRGLAWAGCAWLAWSGASLSWAPSAQVGWRTWYGWLVASAIALAVAALGTRRDARGHVAAGLVWGAALASALGIAQARLGWQGIPQASPPAASFGHRNFAAEVVVLALPFALARFAVAPTPPGWLAALAAWGTMAIYLVYVSSTAAWIAALLSCGALLVCLAAPRIRGGLRFGAGRFAALGLALLALAAAGASVPTRTLPSPGSELAQLERSVEQLRSQGAGAIQAPSARERLYAIRNTLPMLRDHPLRGVGVGGWRVHFPRYAGRDPGDGPRAGAAPPQAENDALQLLAETGLVGGVLLLLGLAALVRTLRHALARSAPGEDRLLLCACLASLAALLVSASVAFPLENAVPPAWAGASLGLLTALALPAARPAPPRPEPALRRHAMRLLASALVIAASAAALDDWRYERARARVLAMLEAGRNAEALRAAAPLLAHPRDDSLLLSRVGRAHLDAGSLEGLPLFEHVRAIEPWNVTNLMNLARSQHLSGRDDLAVDLTRRALEIAPSCAWCRQYLERRLGERE